MSYTGEFHSGWSKRPSRLNEVVVIGGKKITVREQMKKLGLKPHMLYKRIKRGMTLLEAVSVGSMKASERAKEELSHRVMWKGKLYTYAELAKISGLRKGCVAWRIKKYGVDLAMSVPKKNGGGCLDGSKKKYALRPLSAMGISRRLGGSTALVSTRIKLGWNRHEAETTPCLPHGGASRHWRRNEVRSQLCKLGIVAV